MPPPQTADADAIHAAFKHDVNMTAAEPTAWLKTAESKSLGQDSGDDGSTGHHSGKRIASILHKKKADLSPANKAHLHKVHSCVSRPPGPGPAPHQDVETSPWRYFLMNWGHDPLKK